MITLPPRSAPAPAVQLEAVHVAFAGRAALCHVDLELSRAQLTVVVGANGAGKSTLLDVVAGSLRPSAGRVAVNAGSMAFVPQRAAIDARLPVTVRDVVVIGVWGRLGSWRRMDAAARHAVDRALDRVALTPLRGRPFSELSGGQRQRALLAQGLARQADLLLLDEPTTALDAQSSTRIRAAIDAEIDRGAAVVCATHDPALVAAADRVVELSGGRVVSDTTVARR